MITSLSSGFLMKYGKSKLLLFTNLVLVIGNCMSLIENIPLQLIGRFIWGMAAGVYTVLVPKFINETAPCELKGPFGGISQVMVTAGILMVAILALPIPYFTLNLAGQVVWLTDKGHELHSKRPRIRNRFLIIWSTVLLESLMGHSIYLSSSVVTFSDLYFSIWYALPAEKSKWKWIIILADVEDLR